MIASYKPSRCLICDHYLTTEKNYTGYRCIDPGHWQAAGLLKPDDYYPLAKIAAEAPIELGQRPANGDTSDRPNAQPLFG